MGSRNPLLKTTLPIAGIVALRGGPASGPSGKLVVGSWTLLGYAIALI